MRREDDIGRAGQRRAGGQGLVGEDIDRRAGQVPGGEQLGERRLVDNPAARRVDQHRARLHRLHHLAAEEAPGLGGQRHVQRHDVALAQQVLQRRAANAGYRPDQRVLVDQRIVRDDLHAHRVGLAGGQLAELPKPTRPSMRPPASRPSPSLFRGHMPAPTAAEDRYAPRSSIIAVVTTYSATAIALAPVAGMTRFPRDSQAATSMLSSPTPSRPTTLSKGAAASTSPRTCVRLRTISAWAATTASASADGESTSVGS